MRWLRSWVTSTPSVTSFVHSDFQQWRTYEIRIGEPALVEGGCIVNGTEGALVGQEIIRKKASKPKREGGTASAPAHEEFPLASLDDIRGLLEQIYRAEQEIIQLQHGLI